MNFQIVNLVFALIDELDELVSELNNIRIKQTFTCYCYSECKKRNNFQNISGNNLTNRFVLNELIKKNIKVECNHRFFEGFNKINNTCYELFFGS